MTETAELADVVLPGVTFAEKDGTFTNTERRVQRVRKAIEPLGQARPDWQIICDLARRLEKRLGVDKAKARFGGWDYSTPWRRSMVESPTIASRESDCSGPARQSTTLARPFSM